MNLCSVLQQEEKSLRKLSDTIERTLRHAPEGSLHIVHNKPSVQYYHRHPNAGNRDMGDYIRKENMRLISQLAQKSYDRKLLRIIQKRLSALDKLIGHYQSEDLTAVYSSLPKAHQVLIDSRGLSEQEFLEQWLAESRLFKDIREDIPEIYTNNDIRVRSKSEKIIADLLLQMDVPFFYEARLQLRDGTVIYPDFTVLNAKSRRIYYLEHLGMMDTPEYSASAIDRILLYEKNGLFPGDHLLMTYETSERPLDSKLLKELIRRYFLSA